MANDLSPCARALFDKVGGYFKVTKPPTPSPAPNGPKQPEPQASTRQPPAVANATFANHISNNAQGYQTNSAQIEVAIPSNSSFDRSAYIDPSYLTQQQPEPVVNAFPGQQLPGQLPQASEQAFALKDEPNDGMTVFSISLPQANFNRDEYLEVADTLHVPDSLSRRKDRQDIQTNQGLLGENLDQRQRAESALTDLRRRTDMIKRAVRAVFDSEPGFDHVVNLNSDHEPAITGDEHKKLYGAIQKVMSLNRFDQVPVEDLSDILRLSETSLKDAMSLDVQIDKEWDEESVSSWVQKIPKIDAAVKASRTSLRILTGGREDRQLYSESIIENSIKVFQRVVDDIIIPLVEYRNSGPSGNVFKILVKYKKDLSALFVSCQKLLSMLAELVSKVQLTDLSLNTLEFVSSNLIFSENAYYEKDSVVGVQKFDGIRSAAMDALCQIFLVKPEQRQGILNEILTSLSKLPASKQSSRQFKLSEGGSVQPVSALIMRLVQASSACPDKTSEERRSNIMRAINDPEEEEDSEEQQASRKRNFTSSINSESQGAEQPDIAIQDLGAVVQPLGEDAQRNASLVINFLVQRAAGTSKSGESPYRNLLDLCVDDFTTCLDSPDWPAAELILRCLMSSMIVLFEGDRTAAPVKNMALEILGNMTAAISRLRSHVKKMVASADTMDQGELSEFLSGLASQALDREGRPEQALAWTGPYRVVLESLQSRSKNDAHLAGASAYTLTSWANRIRACFEAAPGDDEQREHELGRLAFRLRMMVEDRNWLASQFEFNSVSPGQIKLSYSVILLGSPLCEAFERMLSILLRSMTSDQATVRSKSLKSISQVLETDPSILDGNSTVVDRILECSRDSSPQVRESALSLIGNCIQMRPALESSLTQPIMDRVSDAGVSVRRRAMRLARDIYLRNRDQTLRSNIASGLLRRVTTDLDDSVREAARQMVEEIWFVPFYQMDDTAVSQTLLAEHTALIVRTVKVGGMDNTLDKVFQSILKGEGKVASGPFAVCSKLVSNMFGYISNPSSDDPTMPSGRESLHVLTIFAKAEPKLFTFEQVRLLKPQLASVDIKDPEDLNTFRAVVIVLKCVLPQLSTVHTDFINELKTILLPKMGQVDGRTTLEELAACVRVILDLLKNPQPVLSLGRSVLVGVHKLGQMPKQPGGPAPKASSVKILSHQEGRKLKAYSLLLGTIALHFELDPHLDFFKSVFSDFKGDSVARLMVDKLEPFATTEQSFEVRRAAIEGIATVCQAWPRNYTIPKVWALFQQAFREQDQQLETIILKSFKEFLLTEERRSEASAENDGEGRMPLTVMGGTSYDDVASATTQRFLKDITRISLGSQDPHALMALEVLGSINRQGLTHPKETGVTLITLETSSSKAISELAFKEHKALHEKHESTIEREYTKAVQSAYEYQRDIVKDTRGARSEPPQAKFHNMMDVLKISKMKNKQRFFERLCSLLEFDLATLDVSQEIPTHMDFTRFVVENLAFMEYHTVGELQTAVRKMEQLVSGVGATLAQAIDSEIFNVRVDESTEAQIGQQLGGEAFPGQVQQPTISVEPGRLRHLATASITLLLVWETRTYLRRLYGMGTSRHDSKAKGLAKDLNKTPTKTQGIHWDKYWDEMTALPDGLLSQESMVQKCKALVELMNVDNELQVADEDDEMEVESDGTPSDGGEEEEGRGRKRKLNSTPGGRKKRARSSSQANKRGQSIKLATEQPSVDADGEVDWF